MDTNAAHKYLTNHGYHVSEWTLRNMAKDGKITASKYPDIHWDFQEFYLDRWMETHRSRESAQSAAERYFKRFPLPVPHWTVRYRVELLVLSIVLVLLGMGALFTAIVTASAPDSAPRLVELNTVPDSATA